MLDDISAFIRHYTSVFVLESNRDIGRKGALFHKSYGSAPKKGSKKIRSAIVYIGNNPVEKKLCARAEQYRWNFLAYLDDDNPFSKPIPYDSRCVSLRKAMKEVKMMISSNKYLTHGQVRRLKEGLSENERDYLVDYMISRYNPINKAALLSYYEGISEMLYAMSSTAGNDFDINEVYYSGTDSIYFDMISIVQRDFQIIPVRSVVVLPIERKIIIARWFMNKTSASKIQISKFLHLDRAYL